MGVADFCSACSDWSTTKKCWPIIRQDVIDNAVNNVAGIFWCRREMMPTFVCKCEQVVMKARTPYAQWDFPWRTEQFWPDVLTNALATEPRLLLLPSFY